MFVKSVENHLNKKYSIQYPSIGGEYKNMYNLPSDRKWLIETKEAI